MLSGAELGSRSSDVGGEACGGACCWSCSIFCCCIIFSCCNFCDPDNSADGGPLEAGGEMRVSAGGAEKSKEPKEGSLAAGAGAGASGSA